MSRQYWTEGVSWATSNATAVATTASETVLVPNLTIPGNYLQDGRALHVWGSGGYGTTGTPTIIFTVRWNGVAGTVLAKSGTITTGSGVGGGASMTAMFEYDFTIQTRSNGSAGTLFTNGWFTLFTTGTAAGTQLPIASGTTGGTTAVASAGVDLTADTPLSWTVTWGTSNAANSIQVQQHYVESIN